MGDKNNHTTNVTKFSKDNPIVMVSTKQSQTQIKNVVSSERPKEIKKK